MLPLLEPVFSSWQYGDVTSSGRSIDDSVPVQGSATISIQASATTASRHYLAAEHLWLALHNARRSKELELEFAGKVAFHIEHRACVISSVLGSIAFLEAVVNEVFEDAVDSRKRAQVSNRIAPLGERCIALMDGFWGYGERHVDLLEKYQMALLFADKPRFDPGRNPFQDARFVIGIRNNLVHFKPRWHEHQLPDKVEQDLCGKFVPNPFLAGTGNPWFPGKCLSAGCAEWACATCRNLASAWNDSLGLPRYYDDALAGWDQNLWLPLV